MSVSVTPRGGAVTSRGGWGASIPFYQDDIAEWLGVEYRSLLPYNLGNQPDTSPWAWTVFSNANLVAAATSAIWIDAYKSPTDPDDTLALQAAINAAIAQKKPLFITGKRTISSTIFIQSTDSGNTAVRLDIFGFTAGTATDRTQITIAWAGGNNTTMFRAQNLFNSNWQGWSLSIPDTASGIVGFDIDTGGTGANSSSNTFTGMHVNLGTAANCQGWRVGESSSSTNISQYAWYNCKVATSMGTASTMTGWRILGGNTLGLNWHSCGAIGCGLGVTTAKDAGGVANGNHSFTFMGMVNSQNAVDFQFANLGSYYISGGRFELGLRFLDDTLGSGGNDNFDMNVRIDGTEIANYAPGDGILFKRTAPGNLTLDNVRLVNTVSNYGANTVTVSARSGTFSSIEFHNCSIACAQPVNLVTNTTPLATWAVYFNACTQIDQSQRSVGALPDSIPTAWGKILRSGAYDGPDVNALVTNSQPANGLPTAMPFVSARQFTVTAMGINVVTAGDAAATVALCIWADSGNNTPSKLVLYAGSVAAATTGYKEVTTNFLLPPGRWWLGTITQNSTTAPIMTGANSGSTPAPQTATGSSAATALFPGYQATNQGNAAPSDFVLAGIIGNTPRAVIKSA